MWKVLGTEYNELCSVSNSTKKIFEFQKQKTTLYIHDIKMFVGGASVIENYLMRSGRKSVTIYGTL
jgi:hypothetical protein